MATIIERNGRFLARVRKDGFKPVSKTFTRKSDATAWGRRVELAIEAGLWKDKGTEVPTLAQAVKEYRTTVVPLMKGAETYAWVFDELENLRIATKDIGDITAADVSSWRDKMTAKGLAAGTIVRRLGLLSGLLTWAHKERGWIKANPVHSVRKPRVSDSRDRVLAVDEQHWLLEGARAGRNDWLADALVVLLESAMRRGELWGITVNCVDFEKRVVHLADTKNGSPRNVPLTTTAAQALSRLADKARAAGQRARDRGEKAAPAPGSERLIPVGDAPAVSLAFRRALKRGQDLYVQACHEAGTEPAKGFLVGVRLHDVRHSCITRFAATGALTVHELMGISGHRSPVMLSRYVNLKAADLAKKLETLSA